LTTAAGQPFEEFDGNGTSGLSGARIDHDGDGVSDFWEFALGTDPEKVGVPGAPDKYTPNLADPSTFQNLSSSILEANLSRMNAFERLGNVNGINEFKKTVGGSDFIFPSP